MSEGALAPSPQAWMVAPLGPIDLMVRAEHVLRVQSQEASDPEARLDLVQHLGLPPVEGLRRSLRVGHGRRQLDLIVGAEVSIQHHDKTALQPLPAFVQGLGQALYLEGVLTTPGGFGLALSINDLLGRPLSSYSSSHGG